jgi:hypothetical protein
MSQAQRLRRSRAARALAQHERRGQIGWDDLAAWPDWADLPEDVGGSEAPAASVPAPAALAALAACAGAVWHAASLRLCIHGPTLQRLQQALGADTLRAVQALPTGATAAADATPLPAAEHIEAWLQARGAELMLAALASPVLRLALRERHWPQTLPQLPSPDPAAANQALSRALVLMPSVKGAAA